MSNSGTTSPDTPLLTLAVTPGEPAGIGPDIALAVGSRNFDARLVWVMDPALLQARAKMLRLPCEIRSFNAAPAPHRAGQFTVLPVPLAAACQPGVLARDNARYVLECLDIACAGCLDHRFDAMITGPVHKAVINDAGIPFTGHTEYLAAGAGVPRTVMMLATPGLRVALVTTHVPLSAVSALVTEEQVGFVLRPVNDALTSQFGIARPRLGVCGLNPHAGEQGHMGREEIDRIIPAIEQARASGLRVTGPLPGDTAFTIQALRELDAVVAMYHDQGLAPLKALGFGEAVNITLGLPFIRTSVDHGTALQLAGTGEAGPDSLAAAIGSAIDMALARRASRSRS